MVDLYFGACLEPVANVERTASGMVPRVAPPYNQQGNVYARFVGPDSLIVRVLAIDQLPSDYTQSLTHLANGYLDQHCPVAASAGRAWRDGQL
jgi:hypothetical protein